MRDLTKLKEAQAADINRPTPLVRWTHRAKLLRNFITAVAGIATAIGALLGAVRNMRARTVAPAAQPPHSDVASTALDRVDEPKHEKGTTR